MRYRNRYASILLAGLGLFLSFTLSGCGESGLSIDEIVLKARDASENITSYRMEMTSLIPDEEDAIEERREKVEFLQPDRLRFFPIKIPPDEEPRERIIIGDNEFSHVIFSSDSFWEVRRLPVPVSGNFLLAHMDALDEYTDLKKLADGTIDGTDCYHLSATMGKNAERARQLAEADPSDPHYDDMKTAVESFDFTRDDIEFWIGKDDFLLRRVETYVEITTKELREEGNDELSTYSTSGSFTFYDFNEPIEIEQPPVRGTKLTFNSWSTAGGSEDLRHQVVNYEINVGNKGIETAYDVHVYIDSPAFPEGTHSLEAVPERSPVDLAPGEGMEFTISWESDLSTTSKEEFLKDLKRTVVHATWADEDGVVYTEIEIIGG